MCPHCSRAWRVRREGEVASFLTGLRTRDWASLKDGGAAKALRLETSRPMLERERESYDSYVVKVREALGSEAFETEAAKGESGSAHEIEEAIKTEREVRA